MASQSPAESELPPPTFFFTVSLGASLFFWLWTWLVYRQAIPDFDLTCATYWKNWNEAHQGVWWFMVFCTDLGGVAANFLITILGAIWQTAIKRRSVAIAWVGIAIGGALLNQGLKETLGRERPAGNLPDRAVFETNPSYPSGHSTGSFVSYGMIAYALILEQRRRPRRVITLLFVTAIVLLIGFSRIYLRAHWFSDVIGGWLLGLAWLAVCLGWLEQRRCSEAM